ncbi:WD domain, G-beta repeat protein [Oesophagostomum dentatum]|uniref:WD domain, G-beta repeat protein n=1 Tax=Oesophagostomum dentatum TaxID=61180 RepID=A0A0B1TI50_OESDE|nr:WD domain, G-beta repeat protein [Oesophagostomum dentatum]
MASAEADGGLSSMDDVGESPKARQRWNTVTYIDNVRIGAINGHLGDPHDDIFRIGKYKPKVVHQKDVLGHTGCVNAVEFNKNENLLASGGDDMRVFVWRVADLMLEEAPKPAIVMERCHHSNIFCYQFSLDSGELFSGGNDGVVIRHDVLTHKPLSVHEDRHPVYSISANPIDINVVAASRESGVVSFYDRRESKDGSFCLVDEEEDAVLKAAFVLKGHRSIVNHVRYSPSNRIITSCGVEKIVKVWSALPIPYSYDKPRIRVKKAFLPELSFDEGLVDDTAEDLNMLNYFDQLDNIARLHADDSPDEDAGDESTSYARKVADNYVVNVDLEGLRAHLMGLETSDEGSATDGNDDDASHAEDAARDGDAEDEDSFRGALRAFRRRRWRMMRNSDRTSTGNDDDAVPTVSRERGNEHEESTHSSGDEGEGPRKRAKRNTDSTDSSDDEFVVCEGGVPIDGWPPRRGKSPAAS